MKIVYWLIVVSIGLLQQSGDDPLPRRGFFGVGLEKAETGARVFSVAPDSTAAAVKIVVGDVIEAVDLQSVTSPEAVVALIGRHKGGDSGIPSGSICVEAAIASRLTRSRSTQHGSE